MRDDPMRTASTLEIEAFDWDIVVFYGAPRVICQGPTQSPRMSSDVLHVNDKHVSSREMLRNVGDGDRLGTKSGNTYVLRGARKDGWPDLGVLSVFWPGPHVPWTKRLLSRIFRGRTSADSSSRP